MLIRLSRSLRRAVPLAILGSTPCLAPAQRAVSLGRPTTVSADQFGLVNTVRELSNGSLFVADPLSGDLWLFDNALKTSKKLGREGSGPGEFRQPDAVWPLRGDTTLLVDLGNARLSLFDGTGKFVRSVSMIVGEFSPGAGTPPTAIMPRGTDDRGRIYFQGSPMGPRGLADSVRVMRYDPATKKIDTVATVKAPDYDRGESGNGTNVREVRIRAIPLAGGDGWASGRNGAVALGRVGMYRIDWIDASGKMRLGSPVSYDRVRVGNAEKKEWASQQALSGGIGMSVENRNGEVTMSFARNRPGNEGPNTDGLRFPDYKPPFDNGTFIVDRAGRLWVQRHLPAGRPPQYDVFSADGALAATVTFPARRRLVGFGAQGLYATATDDDGLQTLERYALPIQ